MEPRQEGEQQGGQEPANRGDESFSRLVSPLLAGFSLPTMVGLVASQTPAQPWRDLSLSCLIAASGLFLASYQLSIGSLYERYRKPLGDLRAGLSFAGILLLIIALIVFVGAATTHWWVTAALAVFASGGVAPILLRGWLRLSGRVSPGLVARSRSSDSPHADPGPAK